MGRPEIVYGTGVTELLYTDREPWQVIKVISDITLEIKHMKSELDASWKPDWVEGGFAGHLRNNSEQRWNISFDPEGRTIRIRKQKSGIWVHKGRKFSVGTAKKFHDYNF